MGFGRSRRCSRANSVHCGLLRLAPRDTSLGWRLDRKWIRVLWRLRWLAGRPLGRQAEPRRVPFQLAVDQPEVAVAAMQGFRVRLALSRSVSMTSSRGQIDE